MSRFCVLVFLVAIFGGSHQQGPYADFLPRQEEHIIYDDVALEDFASFLDVQDEGPSDTYEIWNTDEEQQKPFYNPNPIEFDGNNFIITQDLDEALVRDKRDTDLLDEGSGDDSIPQEPQPEPFNEATNNVTSEDTQPLEIAAVPEETPVLEETPSEVPQEETVVEEPQVAVVEDEQQPKEGSVVDEVPEQNVTITDDPPIEDKVDAPAETKTDEETKPAESNSDAIPPEETPTNVDSPPTTPGPDPEQLSGRSLHSSSDSSKPDEETPGAHDADAAKSDATNEDKVKGEEPPQLPVEAARASVNEKADAKTDASTGDPKESTPPPKKGSGGGQITLLIVAAIIIIGAAAFTYNYCKKKMTPTAPEPDKELVEITVNKRVDPVDAPGSLDEKKRLLESKNANGSATANEEKEAPKDESNRGAEEGSLEAQKV